MSSPSVLWSVSSATRVRSRIVGGRERSKFSSTITSVPPLIGSASGCAAFAASASSQVAGCSSSIGRVYAGQQAVPDSASALTSTAFPPSKRQLTR